MPGKQQGGWSVYRSSKSTCFEGEGHSRTNVHWAAKKEVQGFSRLIILQSGMCCLCIFGLEIALLLRNRLKVEMCKIVSH